MAEFNSGQLAAKQLKRAGIDTAFGVVAGPMIEVMAGMQAEGNRVVKCSDAGPRSSQTSRLRPR